mgnify:CR=1 FL=1
MEKLDYKKPTIKVIPLILKEPILAESGDRGPSGTEESGDNQYSGGF